MQQTTPPAKGGGKNSSPENATLVGPNVWLLRCSNPGVMELDGTNTWLIKDPTTSSWVVVDPGPSDHDEHIEALRSITEDNIALTLVTHGHSDHTGVLGIWAQIIPRPIRAWDLDYCYNNQQRFRDNEVVTIGSVRIIVLHTPGHTRDSVCFLVDVSHQIYLLSGDTILGTGSTMVDSYEGALKDYMESLERLKSLGLCELLPGHGPIHLNAQPVIEQYQSHREQRITQVQQWLSNEHIDPKNASVHEAVQAVYGPLPKNLLPAAQSSIQAQLDFLSMASDGTYGRHST